MERLLDVLDWLDSQFDLRELIVTCHPTTSSKPDENDIMLREPGTGLVRARFEVSDVASEKDGNDKERKDLAGFGVLEQRAIDWSIRRFLVVSREFGKAVSRSRDWKAHLSCALVHESPSTLIFEVKAAGDQTQY